MKRASDLCVEALHACITDVASLRGVTEECHTEPLREIVTRRGQTLARDQYRNAIVGTLHHNIGGEAATHWR
jgi:hypothetical protein